MSEPVNNTPLSNEEHARAVQHMSFMSPEIEARFKSGPTDPSLLQLAAQSFSTHQLLERASALGLLAQLQGIFPDEVNAFKQEQLKAREDEAKFEKRMLETLAGVAMAVAAPEAAMAETKDPYANPDRAMWKNVSSEEISLMSYQDWSKLTEGQKQGLMAETADRAQASKNDAGTVLQETIEKVREDSKARGLSEEENQKRTQNILEAVTTTVNHDGLDLKTEAGQDAAKARIAQLKPEDQALAKAALESYTAVYHAQEAEDKITAAQKPAATDSEQYTGTTSANKHIVQATTGINQARQDMQNAPTPAQIVESNVRTNEALKAAATDISSADAQTKAEFRAAVDAQRVAGSEAYVAQTSQAYQQTAAVKGGSDSLGFDDESAKPAVVAAVPSITIPGKPPVVGPESPLLAQLGAPEPANDPAVQEQQLRQTAKASMGAPGGGMG